VLQLLVIANVIPSTLILSILMMEAIRSCETLVLTGATRRRIPDVGIHHSNRGKKHTCYMTFKQFPLQWSLADISVAQNVKWGI
jgi:hypothetical protein